MNKDETKTAEFAENERRIKDLELVSFSCVCVSFWGLFSCFFMVVNFSIVMLYVGDKEVSKACW